jgi:hypothetical protein
MERKPFVTGRFYPDDKTELNAQLDSFFEEVPYKAKVFGIVVPHAGYMYSGKVAGAVWYKIEVPDLVIIIGPNHSGQGAQIAVWPDGQWETPLGKIQVDEETATRIITNSKYAAPDTLAHANEHSIEVQLPFIQLLNPKAQIVPIVMGNYSHEAINDLIESIDVATQDKNVLFVASSDFSHYEPEYTAKARDRMAIEEIKKLDWLELFNVVIQKEISMCGLGPIAVIIGLSKLRGAQAGKLVSYSNSGVMSRDYSNVVTYAGIALK